MCRCQQHVATQGTGGILRLLFVVRRHLLDEDWILSAGHSLHRSQGILSSKTVRRAP